MNEQLVELDEQIDGVFAARQDRSRKSRDAFIHAGFALLNKMRLSDLKVSDLAQHSGRSVGSFYKRFEDKNAFFRALQAATIVRSEKIIESRISSDRLNKMTRVAVMNELVDTLADIFTSDARGVLRESLLRILEPEDGWVLMRKSGQEIQQRIVDRLKSDYTQTSAHETERKMRFCYQIVVGVLQNDLVNDFHTFSARDGSVRTALKAAINDHMKGSSRY